ncbi:uncharacterized protein MKZ38_003305 [Zalerion maritima]|uniref:Uncharacterized protein n=1 Tax=Zalerion maritima TaxID=339359 RepID=A0AAD5RNL2_9PEZI|nr:uncharacterized protein MKZ38_003305 [Zalerion maritima]
MELSKASHHPAHPTEALAENGSTGDVIPDQQMHSSASSDHGPVVENDQRKPPGNGNTTRSVRPPKKTVLCEDITIPLDPNGNVLVLLKPKQNQTPVENLEEEVDRDADQRVVEAIVILASLQTIGLASPKMASLVQGDEKVIDLSDDDPDVAEICLRILHHETRGVPKSIPSARLLLRFAYFVEKYGLAKALSFQAETWLGHWGQRAVAFLEQEDTKNPTDMVRMINWGIVHASLAPRGIACHKLASRIARLTEKPLADYDMNTPEQFEVSLLFDGIALVNAKRESYLEKLLDFLAIQLTRYANYDMMMKRKERLDVCSKSCASKVVGALILYTMHIRSDASRTIKTLFAPPGPPYMGLHVDEVYELLKTIPFPTCGTPKGQRCSPGKAYGQRLEALWDNIRNDFKEE